MNWPNVLSHWSFDPSVLIGVALFAILYWRGRRTLELVRSRKGKPASIWNVLAFYAGLAVIVLALESPIDTLSATLFTFHMIQHLLLIMVAAPLLLLGDPLTTSVRGIPLRVRRSSLGWLTRRNSIRTAGHLLGRLGSPVPAAIIFVLDLYAWHWSWLFNLTLRNSTVHLVEHLCFLFTALLFWGQVIDIRGARTQLSYLDRAVYTVLVSAAGNVLAMYFVFTPKPLYSAYAHLSSRTYGMTPLGDQQIAGAIMWVPVLFIFGAAFSVFLWKALQDDERQAGTAPCVAPQYSLLPSIDTVRPPQLASGETTGG